MAQKKTLSLGLLLSAFFLIMSYGLEWFANFQPCPLCQLQRVTLFLLLLFYVFDFVTRAGWLKSITRLITALLSSMGLALAGRQIWIQHIPTFNANECSVSLERMLQIFPWKEVMVRVLSGSSDCAETSQKLLSIDLSIWSFSAFLILLCISLYGLMVKNRRS